MLEVELSKKLFPEGARGSIRSENTDEVTAYEMWCQQSLGEALLRKLGQT